MSKPSKQTVRSCKEIVYTEYLTLASVLSYHENFVFLSFWSMVNIRDLANK